MKHLSYLLLAALFVLVSCQVKIPEGIILPDKMESVLYDYHMAQAIGSEANVSSDYHKKLFHEYVFAKHGIDKALFDSSLVWYTRHPAYLTQIYANLQEELDNELAIMQDEKRYTQGSKLETLDIWSDTLDLWSGREVDALSSSSMNNLINFSYSSDSAFVAGDSIVLTLGTRFFSEKPGMQKLYAAVVVNYTDNDKAPSYRLDDYSMTGEENSSLTEDSVLLNGNRRNQINLTIGQSKTLKAYRGWEIIPVSYNNYIITPDFTSTVLVGNDVVSLSEKDSPSAGEGDWMTLTALKECIAIIEVAYDAIEVSGGSFDGVYGASDPNRTGLLIVQLAHCYQVPDFG